MHESENNKTDGRGKQQPKIQPSQGQPANQLETRSVGVGDYPIKQPIMQWTAVFMEGRYYLADPLSIHRLQQIQSQIQLQKKLAEQDQKKIDRAESVVQAVISREECSFASEFNHNRQVKNESRAIKQLQTQEQLLAQRLAQKKDGKKVKKNLIKVKGKEDLQSEKQKPEKQKQKQEPLENKSQANHQQSAKKQLVKSIAPAEIIEKPIQVPKPAKAESIANGPVYQRAGNSFFDRLDNNILELEDHIDNIQQFNQPILQDLPVEASKAQIKQTDQKSLQVQPQNDKSIQDPLNKAQIQSQGYQKSRKSSICGQLLKEIQADNDQHQLKVLDFSKKKTVKLAVAQGIVNYQIFLPPGASNVQKVSAQKQQLSQQINLLKQAIGQLRVERLKYHINQSEHLNQQQADMTPSNYHPSVKAEHNGQFSQGQTNEGHHVIESVLNNFTESVVSEYMGRSTPQKKLARTLSGKIIKNVTVKTPQRQVIDLKQEPVNIQQTISNEVSQKITVSVAQEAMAQAQQNRSNNRMTDSEELAALQVSIQSKVFAFSPKKEAKEDIQLMRLQEKGEAKTIIPLISKAEQMESQMQSSMPRPLIKNTRSQAPNFIVKEVSRKQQNRSNKKIMGNFEHLSKISTPPAAQSMIDPKRRAAKEGFIKTIEAKIAQNTSVKQLGHESTFRQKIFNDKQNQKSNAMGYGSEATKGNQQAAKGYRLRRQSQTSRNSRASHSIQSHKSCGCSKITHPINGVYVPALSRAQHEKSSSKQEDHPVYETDIKTKKSSLPPSQKIQLKSRNKQFTKLQMPALPQPPSTQVTVEEMVLLLKRMDAEMGLRLGEGELQRLVMKKYKNCIMFDLASLKGYKIVWHYSGKLYIGEWDEVEMFKAGKGEEYVPQKYYYKGTFQSGKRSGEGCLLQTNGNRYEGQWLNGQKHGKGKYYDSTLKLFYQGQWNSSKRQGSGYLQIEQQSKYQGAFLNNYRHGVGKQVFFNGDSYQGNYQKGKFHGSGTYRWASGARYEGDFFEGCKHGHGKWMSENGDTYAGQYRQDKKSGAGQYAWANGCVYEGEFSQDKKDGNGALFYADGRRLTGIWKDGQLIDTIEQTDGPDEPLAYKKSRAYETTTVFKVVDSVAGKLNSPNKMSPF